MTQVIIIGAKVISSAWMVGWFLLLLKITINHVNNGKDPIAAVFALAFAWALIGLAPVAIAKFAWRYIA